MKGKEILNDSMKKEPAIFCRAGVKDRHSTLSERWSKALDEYGGWKGWVEPTHAYRTELGEQQIFQFTGS